MKFFIYPIILSLVVLYGQPVINQFTPLAANPGMAVTISGQGFHTIADSNKVFFGPVRAQVLDASSTTITAIVPYGARHDFITVVAQQAIAFSKRRFLPASGTGTDIGSKAFFTRADYNPGIFCNTMDFADFDGDGFTDPVTINYTANTLRILKNATYSHYLFLQPLDLPLSSQGSQVAVGDVNADGKPDIVVSINNLSNISVFINSSTPGNFSFSPEKIINVGTIQAGIVLDDIDGDGKTDIVAVNPVYKCRISSEEHQ